MTKSLVILAILLINQFCFAQADEKESIKDQYFKEQKAFAGPIAGYIYSDFSSFNSMSEHSFKNKIDSLETIFNNHLKNYSDRLEQSVIDDESIGITYFFDKLLLEYPSHYENYTGNKILLSSSSQSRLKNHIKDFNNESLLTNRDFRAYVKAFLKIQANLELSTNDYSKIDNQLLTAIWKSIDTNINIPEVKDFWRQEYLFSHIDNIGIKNIEEIYNDFITNCQNAEFVAKTKELYDEHQKGRSSHTIQTYKVVDGFKLDVHLFLPDADIFSGKRPVMVYFHGGSWTEGKPDWFFGSGEYYAKQGWVAVAIEYRINARHGNSPFESVKDAKSAIRWLRVNASQYNIDPSKIVATGNSAGGHLAMASALADNWNEVTDDMNINASPDVLLVTSGVFDLTVDNTKWVVKGMENKEIVKEISPNHLLKSNLPPMLVIHGEKDKNCLYSTAEYFVDKSKTLGNDVELHTIKGARHFIWFGKYAGQVSKIKREYLERLELN